MKYMLVLVCSFLLFSCSGGSDAPKDIIGRQKMETILWQLMQADEFTASAYPLRDSTHNLTTERIRRYKQVFALNQTSKEEFEKSYQYYMAHPDITKVMFDSISSRANRLRDEASHPQPVTTPPVLKPKPQQSLQHIKLPGAAPSK